MLLYIILRIFEPVKNISPLRTYKKRGLSADCRKNSPSPVYIPEKLCYNGKNTIGYGDPAG